MNSQELYQEAYNAHYKEKKYEIAIMKYLSVIRDFPGTNEERYARQQLPNVLEFLDVELLELDDDLQNILDNILISDSSAQEAANKQIPQCPVSESAPDETAKKTTVDSSENTIGNWLQNAGGVIIVLGIIGSVVLGKIVPLAYDHFNWGLAIAGVFASVISGLTFLGFGEIVNLLQNISNQIKQQSNK